MTALIALLILTQSPTVDAEVFVDRGETYIRAGSNNGLEVGIALEVLDAKSRAVVGTAAVMEVWESLSRISIDSRAAALPALKVVRVSRAQEFAPVPAYPAPAPAPAPVVPRPTAPAQPPPQQQQVQPLPPPQPMPPVQPAPPLTQTNALVGFATASGSGDLRRVVIFNRSTRDWHDCDIRLANNRHYRIGDLDRGDQDGVMLFRFEYDGAPAWPAFNGITVICREGIGRFPISL